MTIPTDYRPAPGLLRERVILVTGAGRGIGRAAALAFAGLGATVIVHGRDETRTAETYDAIVAVGAPEPARVHLDFATATETDYGAFAASIAESFGRLDGILHSAIHLEKLMAADALSEGAWQRLLKVNFLAPLLLTRAAAGLLKAAPDDSVIYTADSHCAVPGAYWSGLVAPKAALIAAMRSQAEEWTQWPGLRANAIVPGPVGSPARAFTHPGQSPAALPAPAAILPGYCFLIGPDSRGISGTVLDCQP